MSLLNIFGEIAGKENQEPTEVVVDVVPPVDVVPVVEVEPSRPEILEMMIDVSEDLEAIEGVIVKSKEPEFAGNEAFADNSEMLVGAVADIKERYGADVEPTLAGMEGFFTVLKNMFDGLGKKSEKKVEETLEYIYNADKIIDGYAKPEFLNGKTFKEGDITVSAPAGLGKNPTLKSALVAINKVADAADKDAKKIGDNDLKHTQQALRIFNKYAKHAPVSEEEAEELLEKEFPIKPEQVDRPDRDMYDKLLDIKPVPVTVPALDEAGVKEAVEVLNKFIERFKKIWAYYEAIDKLSLDHGEMSDSKFWDAAWETDACEQLNDGLYFQSSTRNIDIVADAYGDVVMPVAKFLESWILNSIK